MKAACKMSAGQWYVLHVYSGFEQKVAQSILEQAKQKDMGDVILDVLVPTQQSVEVRRGKKHQSEKKIFPGYILVNMVMNSQSWHLVKDTPKVTDFLGNNGEPVAISEAEVDVIRKQIEEGVSLSDGGASFIIGEQVRVIDGPFTSFNGKVEEVDGDRAQIKVLVAIFGRATPVVLGFAQVEKV